MQCTLDSFMQTNFVYYNIEISSNIKKEGRKEAIRIIKFTQK